MSTDLLGRLASLIKWPADTLELLFTEARTTKVPSETLINQLRDVTILLPPEAQPFVNRSFFAPYALPPSSPRVGWPEMLSPLSPSSTDEDFLAVWPARTKKDLSIRRLRMRDVVCMYEALDKLPTLWRRAACLPHFDYVSVCNVLAAAEILSVDQDWFDFWNALGGFNGTAADFGALAKTVTNALKTYAHTDLPRFLLLENGALTGYRNYPFPGFSAREDALRLAAGDPAPRLPEFGIENFTTWAWRLLLVEPTSRRYRPFRLYVTSGDWRTAGASSMGRVQWEFDGKTGKPFKARKNLAVDVLDLDALYLSCLDHVASENWNILKAELNKLRTAVSSDIETYLIMDWILSLCGDALYKWPGTALGSRFFEVLNRISDILHSLGYTWRLPFDLDGFDGQPETPEMVAICEVIIAIARKSVPPEGLPEFERVAQNFILCMKTVWLNISDPALTGVIRVLLKALASGLRVTSAIGNAWNTIKTNQAIELLERCGVWDEIQYLILGDDSDNATRYYSVALALRNALEGVGARGGEGKFGIHAHQTEFLRVWYTPQRAYGYPARVLPGLFQRKPWNPLPWAEASTMAAVWETTRTLRRRGANARALDALWSAATRLWSQREHLSALWLTIPLSLGGLGAAPWDGHSFPSSPWPKVDTSGVRVLNATGWRSAHLVRQYADIVPISPSEADALADLERSKMIASDDVPSVNKAFRDAAEKPPPSAMITTRPFHLTAPALDAVLAMRRRLSLLVTPSDYQAWSASLSRGLYGSLRRDTHIWEKLQALSRVRKLRVLTTMRDLDPLFVEALLKVEHRGLTRSEAVDWILGTTSIGVPHTLHPLGARILNDAVVALLALSLSRTFFLRHQFTQMSHLYTALLEPALLASPLVLSHLSW